MFNKCKSFTENEIKAAAIRGEKIWQLDTGNDGQDDILIGDNASDIEIIITNYYDIEDLPDHWDISEITQEIHNFIIDEDRYYDEAV